MSEVPRRRALLAAASGVAALAGCAGSESASNSYPREDRPIDHYELEKARDETGGALFGSMLTTTFGIGVLGLAVFPAIGQFGILTAMSIGYAFLASLLVIPSALVVWDRVFNADWSVRSVLGSGRSRPPAPVEGDD